MKFMLVYKANDKKIINIPINKIGIRKYINKLIILIFSNKLTNNVNDFRICY